MNSPEKERWLNRNYEVMHGYSAHTHTTKKTWQQRHPIRASLVIVVLCIVLIFSSPRRI